MGVSGNPAMIIEAARPTSLRDSPTGWCTFPGTDVPGSRPTSLRDWMIASWNFAAERNRRHGMWSRNDIGAMVLGRGATLAP